MSWPILSGAEVMSDPKHLQSDDAAVAQQGPSGLSRRDLVVDVGGVGRGRRGASCRIARASRGRRG